MMDLSILRHSCSHVMAQAVKELYGLKVKLGIGPAIEDGFYYDFEKDQPFSPEDLERIEKRMQEIIDENLPLVKEELTKKKALELFKKLREDYKLGLIKDIPEDVVTIYKTADKFIDLCRGPHVTSTGQIKAFKLLSIAGAYWHGIETNPMLQRIYGTAFETKDQLSQHLKILEEAKKRDHRKVGKDLRFFDIYHDEAGAGLVFYLPKGAILRNIIEEYERKEHIKRGYQMVITPHILKGELWQRSGHYDYYRENMYIFQIENKEYAIRPMNCPGHMLIYRSQTRSYRDLPLRYFELGTVYRHEKSGVLHGLLRVRGFTQDDAHIFCGPGELKTEIKAVIDFVKEAMADFGFKELALELSTRPEKYIGNDSDWQRATQALEESLKENTLDYTINSGEGAFYGPKIDIKLKDALKRQWQCATIQCDFALPERFDLTYIDADGQKKRPIILHRVILGSIERFIGALLEHYAGALPLWLSPVQVVVIPIKKDCQDYALKIAESLKVQELRISLDDRNETLEKRIRDAEMEKVPYILIVGEREVKSGTIAIRKRQVGDEGQNNLEGFITRLKEEIRDKV